MIHKLELKVGWATVPKSWKPLSVQLQEDFPMLWYSFNGEDTMTIYIEEGWTGWEEPDGTYLGTTVTQGLVSHWFYKEELDLPQLPLL